MQHVPAQDPPPQNLEMSLREHLLAASGPTHPSPYPPPPIAGAPGPEHPYQHSDSASPEHQLDPGVAQSQHQAPYAHMSGDSAGDDGLSPQTGKGSKRELSTSKRAAQNRAAQRAFRQRKEGYIKKLEEQVKEFQTMETNFRTLQNENYQLREYIVNLQSLLLETQMDVPPAPSHINLSSSSAAASAQAAGPSNPPEQRRGTSQQAPSEPRQHEAEDAMSQLRAAAVHAEAASHRQHQSPYGLGAQYGNGRSRGSEGVTAGADTKPAA